MSTWELLRFNGQSTPRLIQTRVALPTISVGPNFTLRTDQSPPAMPASLINRTPQTQESSNAHPRAPPSRRPRSSSDTKPPITRTARNSGGSGPSSSSSNPRRVKRLRFKPVPSNDSSNQGSNNSNSSTISTTGGSNSTTNGISSSSGGMMTVPGSLLKRPNLRGNPATNHQPSSSESGLPSSAGSGCFPVVLLYMVRGSPNSLALELRHGDRVDLVIGAFRQRLDSEECTRKYLTLEWDFFAGDKFATKIASHTQILGPCTILAVADPSYKATTLERASKADSFRSRAESAEMQLRNCLAKLGAVERDSQERIHNSQRQRTQLHQKIQQLESLHSETTQRLRNLQSDRRKLEIYEVETRRIIDSLAQIHGISVISDDHTHTKEYHQSASEVLSLGELSSTEESNDVKTDGSSAMNHNVNDEASSSCSNSSNNSIIQSGILKRRYSNMRETDSISASESGINQNTSVVTDDVVASSKTKSMSNSTNSSSGIGGRHTSLQRQLYDLAVLQWRPFYGLLQWSDELKMSMNDRNYRIWSPECISLRSRVDPSWTPNAASMDADYYRNATISISDDSPDSELCDSPSVSEEIRDFLVRNGENCIEPSLRGRSRKKLYDGLPFEVQTLPDDSCFSNAGQLVRHSAAVSDDHRCLVSTKHIPKFTVLSQYVGGVYTRREYDLVFARSREETLRNMYAFDTGVELPNEQDHLRIQRSVNCKEGNISIKADPHLNHPNCSSMIRSDFNDDDDPMSLSDHSGVTAVQSSGDDGSDQISDQSQNQRKIAKKNGPMSVTHHPPSLPSDANDDSETKPMSSSLSLKTDNGGWADSKDSDQKDSQLLKQRTEIVIGGLGFINQSRSQVSESQLIACRFVDCRKDISSKDLSVEDAHRYNVEFVTALINGWPSIFCVARRRITAGEIMCAHFGDDYAATVVDHRDYLAKVQKVRDYVSRI